MKMKPSLNTALKASSREVARTSTTSQAAVATAANVFVPITDELLYDHPDQITGPLVAYAPGHVCSHWLSIEINPVDDPFALADDLFDNAAA